MRTEKEAMGKVSGCTMKGQEAITGKKKKSLKSQQEKESQNGRNVGQ